MEEQSESDADDTQLLCTLAVVVVAVVVDDFVVVAVVAATSAAAAEAVPSHALLKLCRRTRCSWQKVTSGI